MKALKNLCKVGLLVAFMGIFAACGESTPKDVAVDFVKSTFGKENADLIDYIAIPKEQNDNATKEYVKGKLAMENARAFEYAQQKGGLDKVEVVNEEIEGERAMVKVNIIFKDGSNDTESFRLQKLDGKWKIKI